MEALTLDDLLASVPVTEFVHVGVDLGQRVDPTAIVVAEGQRRDYALDRHGHGQLEGGELHYLVRVIERLPLGTSYPNVVGRLVEINRSLGVRDQRFWVDATGVGQPVIDLLDDAGLLVVPVYLTATDRADRAGRDLRLGKALMVSRLQVLLQSARIHLPQTTEARALVDELLNYEIRVSEDAHAQFGAFKTGTHDDLATALGLACWEEGQGWAWGLPPAGVFDRR